VEHGNEDIGDDDWFYADWDFETERIWDTVMTACARA
jgi:hypothetical protein